MDFAFDETQEAIRGLAKKILGDLVTPENLRELEKSGEWFHRPVWDALAKAEMLGLAVPEAQGGAGLGLIEVCLILHHVGRTAAPVPALATLVMGALPVAEFGTEDQKQRYLPGVAKGETVLTAALATAGSNDPRDTPVLARNVDGRTRLTGHVSAVPTPSLADAIVVPARDEAGLVGLFLVESTSDGVSIESQIATNSEPFGLVTFEDATCEALGVCTEGGESVEWLRLRTLVGLCALQLGVAEKAMFMTAEYSGERKQFGVPIGTFQAVTQRIGDVYIDIQAMKVSLWNAAWRLASGRDATREVAIAKFWAAEGGHRAVAAAQHIHGGMGFDRDYPLFRYFLSAKRNEFTLGGANAQLAALGAHTFQSE